MTTATSPAQHLTVVIDRWQDLRAALADRTPDTWPPAGRMADYLAALDAEDAELVRAEHRAERAERNVLALGEHPVPLRLPVLDAIRTVEAALVHLADQAAAAIQRPVMEMPTGDLAGWTMPLIARRAALVREDREDPRRWRGGTAPEAAQWLIGRLEGGGGPFQPFTPEQARWVGMVAAEAARRVETALGIGRAVRVLVRPCPSCGDTLTLRSGGTALPEVVCAGCGHTWAGAELVALLGRLEPAA